MKSSSYRPSLAMLLEHIDNAKKSARSSLLCGQEVSQTTEQQARKGHHTCSRIMCRTSPGYGYEGRTRFLTRDSSTSQACGMSGSAMN
jgi:hypothetical protein